MIDDVVLLTGFSMAWAGWVLLMHRLSQTNVGLWDAAGMIVCAGILFGALGINIAHELGHRREKVFQRLAQGLLLLSMYMHFYIEHNRGHHRRMATPEDPATARRGEVVYAFLFRSVFYGWLSAWKLEGRRLRGKTWKQHLRMNQMLQHIICHVDGCQICSFYWDLNLLF